MEGIWGGGVAKISIIFGGSWNSFFFFLGGGGEQ